MTWGRVFQVSGFRLGRFQVPGPWAALFLPQSFCLTGSAGDGESFRFLVPCSWFLSEETGCNPVALSIAGALIFLPEGVLVFLREKGGVWGDGGRLRRIEGDGLAGSRGETLSSASGLGPDPLGDAAHHRHRHPPAATESEAAPSFHGRTVMFSVFPPTQLLLHSRS